MPSPEPEPDKRCGTCEHYECHACWLELPTWLNQTITMDVNRVALAHESCSFWTPKPTPENKEEVK